MSSYFSETEARSIIRDTYGQVHSDGVAVAEALYATEELERLPRGAVTLALGVGHPVRHAGLKAGETVLDIGSGAGIDTLLAGQAVGRQGKAIGLDMTPAMLERAREHVGLMGLGNVELREGLMEELPLPDASVDAIVSNGVLNLSTRKSRALAEMLRVLRPEGRVSIADFVITEALPEEVLNSPAALAG